MGYFPHFPQFRHAPSLPDGDGIVMHGDSCEYYTPTAVRERVEIYSSSFFKFS